MKDASQEEIEIVKNIYANILKSLPEKGYPSHILGAFAWAVISVIKAEEDHLKDKGIPHEPKEVFSDFIEVCQCYFNECFTKK